MLRQVMYVSSSNPPGVKIALDPIYDRSRHNNALDGVTGLLFSDGLRFLQVLEGFDEAVGATMTRIASDPRHRDVQVLRDEIVPAREFGHWSMADRFRDEPVRDFRQRLLELLGHASPAVRDAFLSLLDERGAA